LSKRVANSLLQKMQRMEEHLRDGQAVEPAQVQRLLRRVRRVVGKRHDDRTLLLALADAMKQLTSAAEAQKEMLDQELRRVGVGREAMQGYNHLKGMKTGQKLYRRA